MRLWIAATEGNHSTPAPGIKTMNSKIANKPSNSEADQVGHARMHEANRLPTQQPFCGASTVFHVGSISTSRAMPVV